MSTWGKVLNCIKICWNRGLIDQRKTGVQIPLDPQSFLMMASPLRRTFRVVSVSTYPAAHSVAYRSAPFLVESDAAIGREIYLFLAIL